MLSVAMSGQEIAKMVSFIKDSPAMADNLEGEVLAPVSPHDPALSWRCACERVAAAVWGQGEMERKTREAREASGIAVPAATWEEILEAGESLGVPRAELEGLVEGAAATVAADGGR